MREFCILFLMSIGCCACNRIIHVSIGDGNDLNDGSMDNPYKTMQKVLEEGNVTVVFMLNNIALPYSRFQMDLFHVVRSQRLSPHGIA